MSICEREIEVREVCEDCGGRGYTEDEVGCEYCEGRGYISIYVDEDEIEEGGEQLDLFEHHLEGFK